MRVGVQISNVNPSTAEKITSHIRTRWPNVTIFHDLPTQDSADRSLPPVLVIHSGNSSDTNATSPMTLTILLSGNESAVEIIFLVDAKLARLTKSELALANRKEQSKSAMSRRDFLFGALRKPSGVHDEPVVSESTCEAKFGCSKCVDICPAPGALTITDKTVAVSSERCVRCGLCAAVCPVAAIQVPRFEETAYRALLAAIDESSAPKKMLVITCHPSSVTPRPWMDIEEVPSIGIMGVRQLALAADSSIGALTVYCSDGLCVGKDAVKDAVSRISRIMPEDAPKLVYAEGRNGAVQIEATYASLKGRERPNRPVGGPWRDYVNAIKSISIPDSDAIGLGFTGIQISDTCTLCNACVDSCPHHALAIQTGQLTFHPDECTGCGYCEQICPEKSITLTKMKGPIKLVATVVYEDEMITCAKCGTPYVSAKMAKKVSTMLNDEGTTKLCPSCRQSEIQRRILGGSLRAA